MTTETDLITFIGADCATAEERRRVARVLLSAALRLLADDEPTTPAHLEGGGPLFSERVSRL